ncbi:hypothetical protein, partial [Gordonia sputi]
MSIESVEPSAGSGAGEDDSENASLGPDGSDVYESGADEEAEESTPDTDPLDWAKDLPLGLLGGVDPAAPDGSD